MNLAIAPHVDDEVLGLGGLLDSSFFVYYCGIDESRFGNDKDAVSIGVRYEELQQVAAYLGFKYSCNEESKVNHYVEQDFITVFEELINEIKPERVFIPHAGYNQDHRTVFNAAFVALRPHDRNHFVDRVLVYEAVHDVIWTPTNMDLNYFVPIDIERKIQAYRLNGSQVRGMRSPEHLRHIAAVRGAAGNCQYAEAFQILRWCENAK
jgi:LmbE family N-acetylglucosaminyl deacetylase